MKAITFKNGTKLTLVKTRINSNPIYTHYFEVVFTDGSIEGPAINMNRSNNLGTWLQDNCDIEGTPENIDLFLTLIE